MIKKIVRVSFLLFPIAALAQSAGPSFDVVSIKTAIREQLDLKLTSARAPVATVVIDYIERPDEN